MSNWIQKLVLAGAVALLSACGGGGGSGTCLAASCGGSTSSSSSSTSSGGSQTDGLGVSVQLLNAQGAAIQDLSVGEVATVRAVVSRNGAPVSGAIVKFSTDSAVGLITNPVSGTKATGSDGVAEVQLQPNGLDAEGAAQVQVAVEQGGDTASGSAVYQVGATQIAVGAIGLSATSIPAYGTSTASITVLLNGVPATTPVAVSFSSTCAASGKATIPSSVQTVNGVATATFTDKGCGATTDTISASVLGKTASTNIVVGGPQASNIKFDSATPATIVLKGTGGVGLSTSSNVTFQVVDDKQNPLPSVAVEFDLSTRLGGILLDNNAAGVIRKSTGSDGKVSVTVSAGTVPTPVWVLAKLVASPSISSQSNRLSISTGRPTQDFYSLSASVLNIEGFRYDGATSALNIRAADRLGNPVPDGTSMSFVSEGGKVTPSCDTTEGRGECSVTFTSAEFRPRNEPSPVFYDRVVPGVPNKTGSVVAGRVTVLSYAQGEESFDDLNANNVYDQGEAFRDLGDAFISNDENLVWSANEQFFPFNANNVSACPAYPADGRYSNAPYKPMSCDGVWGSAHVRRHITIVLSSHSIGEIYPSAYSTGYVPGSCPKKAYQFLISDENGNPLAAGTKLDVVGNVVNYVQSGQPATASITIDNPTVPNSTAAGGTLHSFTVEAPNCSSFSGGTFQVRATSPTTQSLSTYTLQVAP